MKHCSVCGQDKPYDQFYKQGKYYSYNCRQCRGIKNRAKTAAKNAHIVPIEQLTHLTCTDCGESKPKSDFYTKTVPSGNECYVKRCKVCSSKHHKNIRASWSEEERLSRYVKEYYNLDLSEYYDIIKDGCHLCGTKSRLRIDHDHKCCPGNKTCGKCIRGCLCDRHNRAEGNFTDDQLLALIKYRGIVI